MQCNEIHNSLHLAIKTAYLIDLRKNLLMTKLWNKTVAENKQRKYIKDIAKLWLKEKTMSKQAKTLNLSEIRRVMDYIATRKHCLRNRALVAISLYSGMRVGEISSLRYCDVVSEDGEILKEIRLRAENTKTKEARTVFISDRLEKELQNYTKVYKPKDTKSKLFYSQKRDKEGFNPNTLTQFYHYLYKNAGIIGASSHSGRRTFATEISSNGVGIRVLQRLLGHKNIQTTAIYVDASDDMLRKAVNLI